MKNNQYIVYGMEPVKIFSVTYHGTISDAVKRFEEKHPKAIIETINSIPYHGTCSCGLMMSESSEYVHCIHGGSGIKLNCTENVGTNNICAVIPGEEKILSVKSKNHVDACFRFYKKFNIEPDYFIIGNTLRHVILFCKKCNVVKLDGELAGCKCHK